MTNNGVFAQLATGESVSPDAIRQIIGDALGQGNWSRQKTYTGFDDDDNWLMTLQNNGTGGGGKHFDIQHSTGSGSVFNVTDAATSMAALVATDITCDTLTTHDAITSEGTLDVDGITTLVGALLANGGTTTTTLTATGNVALGDANADTLTLIGILTVRNAANTATQLYISPADNRVLIGSATALTTAPDDKASVIGGALHIASLTAASPALVQGWRFGAAATAYYGLWIDAATNPSLIFKDDGGVETVRFGDAGSTYQLLVTGDANITDDLNVTGDMFAAQGGFGTTSFSGAEKLRVVGATRLEGTLTVTTGGGSVTGNFQFLDNLDVSKDFVVDSDLLFADESARCVGIATSSPNSAYELDVNGNVLIQDDLDLQGSLAHTGSTLGFYSATPVVKPTISGVRTGTLGQLQSVVGDILDKLDNYLGLVTDSTT